MLQRATALVLQSSTALVLISMMWCKFLRLTFTARLHALVAVFLHVGEAAREVDRNCSSSS